MAVHTWTEHVQASAYQGPERLIATVAEHFPELSPRSVRQALRAVFQAFKPWPDVPCARQRGQVVVPLSHAEAAHVFIVDVYRRRVPVYSRDGHATVDAVDFVHSHVRVVRGMVLQTAQVRPWAVFYINGSKLCKIQET